MSGEPKAFALNAAEGVDVHIDDGSDTDTFDVTVIKDGETVATHKGATVDDLTSVETDLFSVEVIEPPSPEEPGDDEDE